MVIMAVACVAAGIVYLAGSSPSGTAVAARVGPTVITTAQVQSEVDAILAVPAYRRALDSLGTLSMAAPVTPKAVAAANGDPDDLLITFAPAKGASTSRPFTEIDLAASVLTRLLYVTSLQEILAERHIEPTAEQLTEGRGQARLEAGYASGGAPLYSALPRWYQNALAARAADVEALAQSIAGPSAVTSQTVEAAYFRTALSDYTYLCLAKVGGGTGGRTDEGCAFAQYWSPEVIGLVSHLPVGSATAPFYYNGKRLAVVVTSRTVEPLSSVWGSVVAQMLAPYSDVVDNLVTSQLGLETVTVAGQYGTYENLGYTFGVLPPDAFNPPTPASKSTKRQPPPRQQFDPFD
jgi:hypothetical protein